MRKFLEKINRKAVVCSALACSALLTFAEEPTASGITGANNQVLDSSLVSGYITEGKNQIVAVLTAGAIIVACFYVWRLIKKALNATK